jgi:hypothetical protein
VLRETLVIRRNLLGVGRRIVAQVAGVLAILVLTPSICAAANLCVKTGGNNATAKASLVYSAGNEAGSTCWQSIGRAVWGSTNRAAPDTGEAAAAGDTVYVFGGTYDYSGTVNDKFVPVYNFANAGTAGNYITVTCVGTCAFTAADAKGPVVGGSAAYTKWYADISLGHAWVISACAEDPTDDPTDNCPSGTVAAKPDTGVVTLGGQSIWIEGFTITGFAPATYPVTPENWPAIRLQNCDDCIVRNNTISEFDLADFPGNSHACCVNVYVTRDSIIEHNDCSNSGGGVSFKDCPTCAGDQSGNIVRFNKFTNIGQVLGLSHQSGGTGTEGRSYWYQNVSNASFGSAVKISGATNDWIFNNTFYGGTGGSSAAYDLSTANTSGVRLWNNIIHTVDYGIIVGNGGATMVADTVDDLEHNVYWTFAQTFYWGSDGNRTFVSFTGAYSDQDQANSPAGTESVNSDPRLANPAGGDFRLCTAAGVPHASCAGASPAINRGVDLHDLDGDASTTDAINAGAYITGNETIGLDVSTADDSNGSGRRRMRRLEALRVVPVAGHAGGFR